MSQQILDKLTSAIENLDANSAEAASKEAVAAKIPLTTSLEALSKGIGTVSEAFDEGEMFIPHLILAGKAFEKSAAVLTANISDAEKAASSKGKILVHTVSGDIHSIGKNICAILFGASGYEVIDAGVDVPVQDIVDQAEKLGVDIILGSALMTTTMPAQRDIINLLKEKGIRDKYHVMFGGAPTSQKWVDDIGADGWSDTAPGAVRVASGFNLGKKKGG
ncbi:MAG: cobalamin-dependent protein [Synergistaceae bacterium]|jgi:trimethylamine corrinoid protein|nr:cobalamin-dependent protein [Synergistaceae bacterium]